MASKGTFGENRENLDNERRVSNDKMEVHARWDISI